MGYFGIPLFEDQIDVDALEKWLNPAEGYYFVRALGWGIDTIQHQQVKLGISCQHQKSLV
jgi:hypothetical protein